MVSELTKEELKLLETAGYSKKAIKIYASKLNVGMIKDPDVTLAYTGPCGDTIKLYLKIDNYKVIKEVKFQYLGCPASTICGSVLTSIINGKTLKSVKKITENDVLKKLGGLPDEECHCAELNIMTLKKAIEKYENSQDNERAKKGNAE